MNRVFAAGFSGGEPVRSLVQFVTQKNERPKEPMKIIVKAVWKSGLKAWGAAALMSLALREHPLKDVESGSFQIY